MVKRVGNGIIDGDIIEFNQKSEPLYLYANGKLYEISPREYNELINVPIDKRYNKFFELRCREVLG